MEKQFEVTWSIKLKKIVSANSPEDAIVDVENIDCQHDGSYVTDSFEIEKVEEVEK